ncbi:MAG TPA: competence protein ComEC, partial [Methylophilaceae bacterium]|nr:competence protein ComEC [Methylophilaceae bacterium]
GDAQRLAADVLIAPHHGSRTSSSIDFVAAVNPGAVIFTVGYRNRFGHPKSAIVERYRQIGSHIYRSDTDGAVLLDFAQAQNVAVKRWRVQARRYWHESLPQPAALAEKAAAR